MANRILDAIGRIDKKLKALDKTKLARLEATNKSLDSAEHFGYQEAQNRVDRFGQNGSPPVKSSPGSGA